MEVLLEMASERELIFVCEYTIYIILYHSILNWFDILVLVVM